MCVHQIWPSSLALQLSRLLDQADGQCACFHRLRPTDFRFAFTKRSRLFDITIATGSATAFREFRGRLTE